MMKISNRDLDKFFNPQSIAVVGVSSKRFNFGGASYLSRIIECGYKGKVYPINPKAKEIMGVQVYPDLEALPEVPDMAIVSLAAGRVPGLLETCGRIGLKHIHLLSAGFGEISTPEGNALEAEILRISKQNSLLVMGPNCLGPYCPPSGLTLYGESPGKSGPLGIISQSGGITQRITEYATFLNLGIEKAVSFGNATVLDGCDYLEYFAQDDAIEIIGMYLESVGDGRRFLKIAKEVNLKKPIVLLLGGRTETGAKTAASHTGAMGGSDAAWEAFSRQTGVILVRTIEEWMDALIAVSMLSAPQRSGVFVGSGGGGRIVIAGDIVSAEGLEVPDLSEASRDALRRQILDVGSIVGNPLDSLSMSLDATHFSEVLDVVYKDAAFSMVLVERIIPRMIYHIEDVGQDTTPAVIEYLRKHTGRKPTVVSIDYDGGSAELA
ncbi:MAG: CoA-binding protein, partial [Deltaproteobacteria bacterium]|nr:CoA-binding protein [Deltaproteobacteria bacterium]